MRPLKERIATAVLGGLGMFFCFLAYVYTGASSIATAIFWLAMSAESFALALAPQVLFARMTSFRSSDNPGLIRHGIAAAFGIIAKITFALALIAWLLSLT